MNISMLFFGIPSPPFTPIMGVRIDYYDDSTQTWPANSSLFFYQQGMTVSQSLQHDQPLSLVLIASDATVEVVSAPEKSMLALASYPSCVRKCCTYSLLQNHLQFICLRF